MVIRIRILGFMTMFVTCSSCRVLHVSKYTQADKCHMPEFGCHCWLQIGPRETQVESSSHILHAHLDNRVKSGRPQPRPVKSVSIAKCENWTSKFEHAQHIVKCQIWSIIPTRVLILAENHRSSGETISRVGLGRPAEARS